MEIFDGTVVATAAPSMARSFGVGSAQIGVVVTAYLLTVAVLIPLSGWLAERFGARRSYLVAIVIFTAASGLCAASTSLVELSVMRVLQGVGGALMVPVGRLVVLRTVDKVDVIRAMSYLVWPALVAPILAPAVGGLLTSYASWRWIFLVNLPLGIAAWLVAARVMHAAASGNARPLDLRGFAGLAVTFGGITYIGSVLAQPRVRWAVVAVGLVVVPVAAVLTVRHLRRTAHPLVSLAPLRLRTFRLANVGGSVFRVAISAVPFLLPLLYQDGFGWSPAKAGLVVLFVFVGNLAIKPLTTPMLQRRGFRATLSIATLGAVLSIGACAAFGPGTPLAVLAVVTAAGGAFRSIGFTAYNTIAYADVPPAEMSAANTLSSTILQLSMGLGVAAGVVALRLGASLYDGVGAYRFAFALLAAITVVAFVDSVRLPDDSGRSLQRR